MSIVQAIHWSLLSFELQGSIKLSDRLLSCYLLLKLIALTANFVNWVSAQEIMGKKDHDIEAGMGYMERLFSNK